ncbi:hypothetical protein [Bosea sp. MMO-172]|uniref:hypothetical protein n=1 Tax=Bosea sp. MMO-172 TaxID=3127885 RepID=UPI0030188924
MAMFAGARISLDGRPFSALDGEVVFTVPEHSAEDIRSGVFRIDIEAPLDTRIGQIIARAQQEIALSKCCSALRVAGLACRAIWIGDDLSWRVGRSGDVVTMLDDLGIPAVRR